MLKKINKAIVSKKNKDIVTVANAVFVKNGFKMEVPFATRNKDVFQCEVRNVNFEDPVSACDSINMWVKNETRGESSRVSLGLVNERVSEAERRELSFLVFLRRPLGL